MSKNGSEGKKSNHDGEHSIEGITASFLSHPLTKVSIVLAAVPTAGTIFYHANGHRLEEVASTDAGASALKYLLDAIQEALDKVP